MAQLHHKTCLLCNSSDLEVMQDYKKAGLVKCTNCNFIFTERKPTEEELIDYYSNNYDRTRYLSPITIKRFHEILDSFEPFRKTGKLLDVGAGYGFFMEVAKERGWDVYGTEITDEAVQHCESKGLKMFKGDIGSLSLDQESFDVVVSIEVIEHLNTPSMFVSEVNKVLRKGGVFYLTTPNFNSYLRYQLKEEFDDIQYPNHLCYYTTQTLNKLLTSHNFKKKYLKTTGISVTRKKTSKGESNQEHVSETSDDEMLRYRIENNAVLRTGKKLANFGLKSSRLGLSMKAFYTKPETH